MSLSVIASARLNRTALQRILRLPGGIVDRDMRRRVNRALQVARRTAPGTMGSYLSASYRHEATGPVGAITNRHPAAIYVVNGTRPHIIRPRRPNGVLRFEINGRVVYARYVNHPGTTKNDFMKDALRAAV